MTIIEEYKEVRKNFGGNKKKINDLKNRLEQSKKGNSYEIKGIDKKIKSEKSKFKDVKAALLSNKDIKLKNMDDENSEKIYSYYAEYIENKECEKLEIGLETRGKNSIIQQGIFWINECYLIDQSKKYLKSNVSIREVSGLINNEMSEYVNRASYIDKKNQYLSMPMEDLEKEIDNIKYKSIRQKKDWLARFRHLDLNNKMSDWWLLFGGAVGLGVIFTLIKLVCGILLGWLGDLLSNISFFEKIISVIILITNIIVSAPFFVAGVVLIWVLGNKFLNWQLKLPFDDGIDRRLKKSDSVLCHMVASENSDLVEKVAQEKLKNLPFFKVIPDCQDSMDSYIISKIDEKKYGNYVEYIVNMVLGEDNIQSQLHILKAEIDNNNELIADDIERVEMEISKAENDRTLSLEGALLPTEMPFELISEESIQKDYQINLEKAKTEHNKSILELNDIKDKVLREIEIKQKDTRVTIDTLNNQQNEIIEKIDDLENNLENNDPKNDQLEISPDIFFNIRQQATKDEPAIWNILEHGRESIVLYYDDSARKESEELILETIHTIIQGTMKTNPLNLFEFLYIDQDESGYYLKESVQLSAFSSHGYFKVLGKSGVDTYKSFFDSLINRNEVVNGDIYEQHKSELESHKTYGTFYEPLKYQFPIIKVSKSSINSSSLEAVMKNSKKWGIIPIYLVGKSIDVKEVSKMPYVLECLEEGRAYEVIKHLSTKNLNLKPISRLDIGL